MVNKHSCTRATTHLLKKVSQSRSIVLPERFSIRTFKNGKRAERECEFCLTGQSGTRMGSARGSSANKVRNVKTKIRKKR